MLNKNGIHPNPYKYVNGQIGDVADPVRHFISVLNYFYLYIVRMILYSSKLCFM